MARIQEDRGSCQGLVPGVTYYTRTEVSVQQSEKVTKTTYRGAYCAFIVCTNLDFIETSLIDLQRKLFLSL